MCARNHAVCNIFLFLSDVKKVLNDVGNMVSDFSKKPAIDDVINTSTAYLNQGQRYFLEYLPYLEKYDFYR